MIFLKKITTLMYYIPKHILCSKIYHKVYNPFWIVSIPRLYLFLFSRKALTICRYSPFLPHFFAFVFNEVFTSVGQLFRKPIFWDSLDMIISSPIFLSCCYQWLYDISPLSPAISPSVILYSRNHPLDRPQAIYFCGLQYLFCFDF